MGDDWHILRTRLRQRDAGYHGFGDIELFPRIINLFCSGLFCRRGENLVVAEPNSQQPYCAVTTKARGRFAPDEAKYLTSD